MKSRSYNSKTSEACQKGLFSLQSNKVFKEEVQIINRNNELSRECYSQQRKDSTGKISRASDGGFQALNIHKQSQNGDLTTSPRLSRKGRRQGRKGATSKRKQTSSSMVKVCSPFNSLEVSEKQACLGKRKNRSRNSECDSDRCPNEGSKKANTS